MKILLLLAMTALVTGGPLDRPIVPGPLSPTGQIVGGTITKIEKEPYQLSLQLYGGHFCGASIISSNWALTAGHCVEGRARPYTIRAGTDRLDKKRGSLHKVVKIILHENYTTNSYGVPKNDLALLQVDKSFHMDETRQTVSLYNDGEESEPGCYATITGWGTTENDQDPVILHKATVPVVSKEACNEAYEELGGIPDGQICAAYPEGGVDSCQGDSGGPMTIAGRQAGIVSWGNGCGTRGYPGVYTEVAYYRDWIRKLTGV